MGRACRRHPFGVILKSDSASCDLFNQLKRKSDANPVHQDHAFVDQVLARDLVLHKRAHRIHGANVLDGFILLRSQIIEHGEMKCV